MIVKLSVVPIPLGLCWGQFYVHVIRSFKNTILPVIFFIACQLWPWSMVHYLLSLYNITYLGLHVAHYITSEKTIWLYEYVSYTLIQFGQCGTESLVCILYMYIHLDVNVLVIVSFTFVCEKEVYTLALIQKYCKASLQILSYLVNCYYAYVNTSINMRNKLWISIPRATNKHWCKS